jgi:hypothetical protein
MGDHMSMIRRKVTLTGLAAAHSSPRDSSSSSICSSSDLFKPARTTSRTTRNVSTPGELLFLCVFSQRDVGRVADLLACPTTIPSLACPTAQAPGTLTTMASPHPHLVSFLSSELLRLSDHRPSWQEVPFQLARGGPADFFWLLLACS